MAGKKQGKTGASAKGDNKKQLGKRILLLSMGEPFMCIMCGRKQKRGMVSEFNEALFCSEDCVRKKANVG